nr:hypothetical protein CFP56_22420 [Quercus suber]
MTGGGDVDGQRQPLFCGGSKVGCLWRGTNTVTTTKPFTSLYSPSLTSFLTIFQGIQPNCQKIEIVLERSYGLLFFSHQRERDVAKMSGHNQPTLQQSYETPGNPASKEPAEEAQTQVNAHDASQPVDRRVPQEQNASVDDATPSSLGYGVRGAPPGEEAAGRTEADVSRARENDGEQMRAPGEGEIASAVDRKPGASGEEQGLELDLDRKKAEQAPAREKVQAEEKKELDVAGILSQRGGPANPVDKDGYPNA